MVGSAAINIGSGGSTVVADRRQDDTKGLPMASYPQSWVRVRRQAQALAIDTENAE